MRERVVELGDVDLAMAESGVGGRPLLLLHGFTGAKEDFTPWLDRLAGDGWHAVAPDLRGHGDSSKPPDEAAYSFDLLAADALQLADALGWSTFVLLGHSMGGMVAQVAAVGAPGRLDGLILMDTAPGPLAAMDPELVRPAVAIVRERGIDRLADLLVGRDNPLDTAAHRRLLAERPGHGAFEERKLRATSPALYAAMALAIAGATDRCDRLRDLPATLAVLVLVGEQDAPFLDPSRRMVDAIAGARLAVVPDAGHSPQFENPDAWWGAVAGFLADLGA